MSLSVKQSSPYVLWGSAGHAKVLASAISLVGGNVAALFDNNVSSKPSLPGVPLIFGESGFIQWVESKASISDYSGLVAIGGCRGLERIGLQKLMEKAGVRIGNLVHPSASVCVSATIGKGTQILAQAVVSSDVVIGESCIINHCASVDHECILGNGVHLAPRATLCGCVHVGDRVFVGAGATIIPRINIGAGAIIGAGAVVIRDVAENSVMVGNPARFLQKTI